MTGVVQFIKKQWFYGFTGFLLVAVISGIVYMYAWGSSRFPVVGQAANFTLTNTAGKPVQLTDSNGKVRLLAFIYTRCASVCPMTTYTMEQVQSRLKQKSVFGKDVEFVCVTIDPKNDTPEELAKYAQAYHADLSGWQFLTGPPNQVFNVLKLYQVQTVQQGNGQIGHPAITALIDGAGNIRKEYGVIKPTDADNIASDIVRLINQ